MLKPITFVTLLLYCVPAYAELGDFSIGGNIGIGDALVQSTERGNELESTLLTQPEINVRLGLTDFLHIDSGLGLATFYGYTDFSFDVGLTVTLDNLMIVPEAKVGLFLLMLPSEAWKTVPGLDVGVAFRHHLTPTWSVALGVEYNWAMVPRRQGTLSFLYRVL